MVLVSSTSNPQSCFEFIAEIYLSMHHTNTPIRKGFETTVQIENIRQTALIIEMDKVCKIEFVFFLIKIFFCGFRKNYMQINKLSLHFDFEIDVNMFSKDHD
jgi:hypothetical protein